jgi:RNA polymerase sigma-70 factor (ECF subfamily)
MEKYRPLVKLQFRTMQLKHPGLRDPRLRRRFDSSDLVQEAFLKAHKNREKFKGVTEAQFVMWLKRIAENVMRDECRKGRAKKRDVGREEDVEQVVSESSGQPTPDQRLEQREIEEQLRAALKQLPDDQQDAFILRHVQGLPLKDAAEQMRRTEKAVSHLVSRARRALRNIIDSNQ